MLIKLGVNIRRLNREIRRTLNVVDKIYIEESGEEAIVSSTDEGNHSPSSLHYKGDAVDFRLAKKNMQKIRIRLKKELGIDYDIIIEGNHLHCEFDPK